MTPEELDHILSSTDGLEPSRGFAQKVMVSVHREADQPAPLQFPWGRFAAGIVASFGAGTAGTVLLLQSDVLSAPTPAIVPAATYAFAVLLVSLGLAAVPRVLSKP